MTGTYVPAAMRQAVTERAGNRCEYCCYPRTASFLAFEMEHVISEKHGGTTDMANLALACPFCNRLKGSDIGSLDPETGILTQFFNPRTQRWTDHFRWDDGRIVALTPEGRVSVAILQLNHPDRIDERERLRRAGQF
jgi:hypothetical protein